MDRRGLLWIVVGSLWVVVDRCGIVVGRCGSLWDRCGSLWIVVDRCGSLWVVPGFSNYVERTPFTHISCLHDASISKQNYERTNGQLTI